VPETQPSHPLGVIKVSSIEYYRLAHRFLDPGKIKELEFVPQCSPQNSNGGPDGPPFSKKAAFLQGTTAFVRAIVLIISLAQNLNHSAASPYRLSYDGLGLANLEHLGAAGRADALSCRLTILHCDGLGVFHFSLSLALYAVGFHCEFTSLFQSP
jgi:hypothetical protein